MTRLVTGDRGFQLRKWIVCVVIGVAMLSLSTGAGVNDGRIMCGGDEMYPGDVCEETRGGATVDTKTYEEMRTSNENGQRVFNSWGRWALLGGGLVLVVLGGVGIVRVRRQRAAGGQNAVLAAAGAQPPHTRYPPSAFPQGQQFAPPQGNPQYGPPHGQQPFTPPQGSPQYAPPQGQPPSTPPQGQPQYASQGQPQYAQSAYGPPNGQQYHQPGPPPPGWGPQPGGPPPGYQPPHDFGPRN